MWCILGMMPYVCLVWWLTHLLWCHWYSSTSIQMCMPSVWWHRYSGCDVKYGGEMSGIVIVLSWKQHGDSVLIGFGVIHILGLMLYIDGYNVINSCYNSMHTEYNFTRIVRVMSYREWGWYNWYCGFDDTDTVDVVLDIVGQMVDITFVLPCVRCHI